MKERLPKKWSFKINGKKQVLIKRREEREEHVLMKVFLAKVYSFYYDGLKIEVRFHGESRFKPDVLALNEQGHVIFWGECGEVSQEKIKILIKKYRDTHLCFSKWNIKPGGPFEKMIASAIKELKKRRSAPVDFINFPEEVRSQITNDGEVIIDWDQLTLQQWR